MRRFSKSELLRINELAERGASLKEISSKMGRCKSAVQYHVAKLRGTRAREKELFAERLTDKELGWLVGCYAGDGSRHLRQGFYSYEVRFALNENEYPIVEFVELLLLRCGMKTRRSVYGKRVYVRCQSKRLFEFVEKYLLWEGRKKSRSVRLANFTSYSVDFLFGFLCGLIDADGGTKQLYISTSSKRLADNVQEICNKLGIASKTCQYDVFHIRMSKSDFRKICQKYEFSSIKHRI